jgi:seryl-tRNA synthetase
LADAEQTTFLAELIDRGLLLDTGVPGLYGHGPRFEEVRRRLEALVSAAGAAEGADSMRFSPLLPRRQLERSGYLASFPHLAGSVYAFAGNEAQAALQGERASAHEDWSEFQRTTDVVLVPAACYPVYPEIASRGPLAPGGCLVDTGAAWVFRHEPSHDPARRQIFHMHELVRIGEPSAVRAWRDDWAHRGLKLLQRLGLEAGLADASDPFFGRAGRMLARSQREQSLKLELVAPIVDEEPTALASFNYHRDHFADVYELRFADGATAHTACLGFGLERIVLALLRAHGLEPSEWPPEVRRRLWW